MGQGENYKILHTESSEALHFLSEDVLMTVAQKWDMFNTWLGQTLNFISYSRDKSNLYKALWNTSYTNQKCHPKSIY